MANSPTPTPLHEQWLRYLMTPKVFMRMLAMLLMLGLVIDWIVHPQDFQAFVPIAIVLGMCAYGLHWFRHSFFKKKK